VKNDRFAVGRRLARGFVLVLALAVGVQPVLANSESPVIATVLEDGGVAIGGTPLRGRALRNHLALEVDLSGKEPGEDGGKDRSRLCVLIDAAPEVPYEHVETFIDTCHELGIYKIVVGAAAKDEIERIRMAERREDPRYSSGLSEHSQAVFFPPMSKLCGDIRREMTAEQLAALQEEWGADLPTVHPNIVLGAYHDGLEVTAEEAKAMQEGVFDTAGNRRRLNKAYKTVSKALQAAKEEAGDSFSSPLFLGHVLAKVRAGKIAEGAELELVSRILEHLAEKVPPANRER
jgi:biopolymer transport protein ExbD